MFRSLFCCCTRSRRFAHDDVIPDENTHLIPPVNSSRFPVALNVDHRMLRDKLSTIVRSKERKMVNVGARTPFIVALKNGASIDTREFPLTAAVISASPGLAPTPLAPPSTPIASTPVSPSPSKSCLHVLTVTPAHNAHSSGAGSRTGSIHSGSSPAGSRPSSPRLRPHRELDAHRRMHVYSAPAPRSMAEHGLTLDKPMFSGDGVAVVPAHMEREANGTSIAVAGRGGRTDADTDVNSPGLSIVFSWSDASVAV
ncbi:hypothetical protein GGX14DRAFT_453875 [Mycena pura]|uniref:Uncharacterized protein n=1 Tax=Mycena pura TaxID=153505 RepID=A0AAD6Y9E2_9AGAR|nr:hypothetical protein GGX14DRAFT_453875 [Mycena pura]